MKVSVVFALPDRQIVLDLDVSAGITVAGALAQSRIYSIAPEAEQAVVGIYGNVATRDTAVQPGDRIEIYRPLKEEPKDARRRRVRKR